MKAQVLKRECSCGNHDCWSCQIQVAVQQEQDAADDADRRLRLAVDDLARSGNRISETSQRIARERTSARTTQRIPCVVGLEVSGLHRIPVPAHILLEEEKARLEAEEEEELNFDRLTVEDNPQKP